MRPEIDEINREHEPIHVIRDCGGGEPVALLRERTEQISGDKNNPEKDHASVEHRSKPAAQPGRDQSGRPDRFKRGVHFRLRAVEH